MRLVTLGILAVLSCAGCAVQTGDPGSSDETVAPTPGSSTSGSGAKTATGLHDPAGTPLVPVMRGNPDPSPWNPPQIPAWSGSGNGNGNSNGNTADEGVVKGPQAAHGSLQRAPALEEPAAE